MKGGGRRKDAFPTYKKRFSSGRGWENMGERDGEFWKNNIGIGYCEEGRREWVKLLGRGGEGG